MVYSEDRRGLPKAVVKVDRQGRIVARYRSMKDAAKANFMCLPSVTARCEGKIKKCWDADGCTYRFAEDVETIPQSPAATAPFTQGSQEADCHGPEALAMTKGKGVEK